MAINIPVCDDTGNERGLLPHEGRTNRYKSYRAIGIMWRKMMRTLVIAGVALVFSTGTTLEQDAAAGEQVFKRLCSSCHEIGQDAKIKLGPPLNGVDGRTSGTFEGFNYSPANKSSGITWSEESFPKYIRAPMQEMPGTRMAFVGIKNDKDSADLWAYLKQFGTDGAKK
jgi:cytochrome c